MIHDIYLTDTKEMVQIEDYFYEIHVPKNINVFQYFIKKELSTLGLSWCATSEELDILMQKVEKYSALGYIPMEE